MKTATKDFVRRKIMLYYDSKVFYSLLLLQQLEVVSPYATLTSMKRLYRVYCIHFCKIANKIDLVTIEETIFIQNFDVIYTIPRTMESVD